MSVAERLGFVGVYYPIDVGARPDLSWLDLRSWATVLFVRDTTRLSPEPDELQERLGTLANAGINRIVFLK